MERRRIRFIGRVQGVGFRATARAVARGLVVSGWVRNEGDGSVLLELQGEREQVEAFLEGLRARMMPLIDKEDARAIATVEGEASFEIRR
jgi:acylphosphatase